MFFKIQNKINMLNEKKENFNDTALFLLNMVEFKELKKQFLNQNSCVEVIDNSESYLQRYIAIDCLKTKNTGEIFHKFEKISRLLKSLNLMDHGEFLELDQNLAFELPSAVEALKYQIIHAIYDYNVSPFSYKDAVEEPSNGKTINYIQMSAWLNTSVQFTLKYLKRSINEKAMDFDVNIFINFFKFVNEEFNFELPLKFDEVIGNMNLLLAGKVFNEFYKNHIFYSCSSDTHNKFKNFEESTKQTLINLAATIINEIKDNFIIELNKEEKVSVSSCLFTDPITEPLPYIMKMANDENSGFYIDLRRLSFANVINLEEFQKTLSICCSLSLNEKKINDCFGYFSIFAQYIITSIQFIQEKIILFLNSNFNIINTNSIILKFKLLLDNILILFKTKLSTLKKLFENKRLTDILKELFKFDDFSRNCDHKCITNDINFEERLKQFALSFKQKINTEIDDLLKKWSFQCDILVQKRKEIFEENFQKKQQIYINELASYDIQIESFQNEIDQLIMDLYRESCYDYCSRSLFQIHLTLRDVMKSHENFQLDVWDEYFPPNNFQENKIFIKPKYSNRYVYYQKICKDQTRSKEELINLADGYTFYITDLISEYKPVIEIRLITYDYFFLQYEKVNDEVYPIEYFKNIDYIGNIDHYNFTISHEPIIKPNVDLESVDYKHFFITMYANKIDQENKIYKIKKIDDTEKKISIDSKNASQIFEFKINELNDEKIKEIRIGIYEDKNLKKKTHRYIIPISELKPGYYLESKYFKINYSIQAPNAQNEIANSYSKIRDRCRELSNIQKPREKSNVNTYNESEDKSQIDGSNDSKHFEDLNDYCKNKFSNFITDLFANNSLAFLNTIDKTFQEIEQIIQELENLNNRFRCEYRSININDIQPNICLSINSCYTDEMINLREKKRKFIAELLNLAFDFKSFLVTIMIEKNFDKIKMLKNKNEINDFRSDTDNQIKQFLIKDNQKELKTLIELCKTFFPIILSQKEEKLSAIENSSKEIKIFNIPKLHLPMIRFVDILNWFQLRQKKFFQF